MRRIGRHFARLFAAAPLAVYALKHRSADVLMGSTSGGAFTAFSDLILEHVGVVFGAVLNEQLQVVHTSARTKAERDAMRGSKYVQSDLNTVFPQIRSLLRQGTEVMFVGTPCQVDSLKEYLRNEHTENLLLCDFVCHGVPSQQMLDDYGRELNAARQSAVTSEIAEIIGALDVIGAQDGGHK